MPSCFFARVLVRRAAVGLGPTVEGDARDGLPDVLDRVVDEPPVRPTAHTVLPCQRERQTLTNSMNEANFIHF